MHPLPFVLALASTKVFTTLALPADTTSQAPLEALSAHRLCKPLPGDPDWPSPSAWAQLNNTISGRLLAPLPPASVCYNAPDLNQTACSAVTDQWFESRFHAQDPTSVDWPNWEDDVCVPPALYSNDTISRGCETTQFPRFVVNARQESA